MMTLKWTMTDSQIKLKVIKQWHKWKAKPAKGQNINRSAAPVCSSSVIQFPLQLNIHRMLSKLHNALLLLVLFSKSSW